VLPRDFVDCTPFNLLDVGKELVAIDCEWHSDRDPALGWVVTRGVQYSLSAGVPSLNRLQSITEVIEALCDRVGLCVSAPQIQDWLDEESDFQVAVTGRKYVRMTGSITSSGLRSFVNEIVSVKQAVAIRDEQIVSLHQVAAKKAEELTSIREDRDRLSKEQVTMQTERAALLSAQERSVGTLTDIIERLLA
jgi:hypothetical protein